MIRRFEDGRLNLNIVKLDSILDKHINFLDKIWSLIILLPLFSLAAGSLSLMSYLITSISEQQKQFGIMRALGTKPKSILKIVFYQASLVLTVSETIGVSTGLYIALNFLIPNPIISYQTLLSVAIGITAIFGILCISSLYPTLKTINQPVTKAFSTNY